MKKNKEWFPIILLWTIVIAIICLGIYALVKYGSKPISEIPTWVVWMFLSRGKR